MMIAPETYIDGFKNKTLDQCIAERDELYKILKKVENDKYSEEEKQYTVSPSISVLLVFGGILFD